MIISKEPSTTSASTTTPAPDLAPKSDRLSPRHDGTITAGGAGNIKSAGTCNSGATDPNNEMWNVGTDGKLNSSLGFDGTDDYVQVPHNSALMPSQITVAAWLARNGNK